MLTIWVPSSCEWMTEIGAELFLDAKETAGIVIVPSLATVTGGAGGSGWANRSTIALIRLFGVGGSVTFIGGEEAATLFDRYSISAG